MTRRPIRKHGSKAAMTAKPSCGKAQDLPPVLPGGKRVRTSLTMARSQTAYLWFTDRGRSRVLMKF